MPEFNLTQREREILTRLLELSQNSKEHFDVWILRSHRCGRAGARVGAA
jgi:hypothetical protein